MGAIAPHSDHSAEVPRQNSRELLWLILFLVVIGALVTLISVLSTRRAREKATEALEAAKSQPPVQDNGSELLPFTSDDVTVNNDWTILSGSYPTVTFTCQPSPALGEIDFAVLCYRTLGETEWSTVETHPRRDNSIQVILRDLNHNMPYECFFITHLDDTTVRSATVTFTTAP